MGSHAHIRMALCANFVLRQAKFRFNSRVYPAREICSIELIVSSTLYHVKKSFSISHQFSTAPSWSSLQLLSI